MDNNQIITVESAVKQIDTLMHAHRFFADLITKPEANPNQHIGEIKKKEDRFEVTCLKLPLRVDVKPVLVDNSLPSTMEYAFVAEGKGDDEDLTVFTMYLNSQATLYRDPHQEHFLCECNGRYHLRAVKTILYELVLAMLKSGLFKPFDAKE